MMIFSALLSFLGGNAFRLIFGEVVAYLNKKQDHQLEIERMRLQGELEAAQHARNLEAIKTQAELGVKTIQVQRDADLDRLDAAAFNEAVRAVGQQTGIKFLDIWNGSIRPALATLAATILVAECIKNGWGPTEHVLAVCDAILGIYVADRSLARRGK